VTVGVELVAASAVAGLVVTLQLTLTGDTASRALWAAIAAASVPVLIILAGEYGQLFKRLVGSEPSTQHHVGLTLLVVVMTGLGIFKGAWLPGALAHCYSPPSPSSVTMFVQAAQDQRYGLIDTPDPGRWVPAPSEATRSPAGCSGTSWRVTSS
jgi:uncharacterized membrane protein